MRELAFVLGFQDLIGPLIDLREEVALLDHLPFGESDLGQLAVDLGLHGDGRERGDGAERVDDDADIAQRDGRGADRLQPRLAENVRPAGGADLPSARSGRRQARAGRRSAQRQSGISNAIAVLTSGSGAGRRRFGAKSSSVLRVRSSMLGVHRSRHVSTYRVRQHRPPNEYSLMTAPAGSSAAQCGRRPSRACPRLMRPPQCPRNRSLNQGLEDGRP